LLGGGDLTFFEHAQMYFLATPGALAGLTSVDELDPYRVKLSGSGAIKLREQSKMIVPQGAYVGVESAGYWVETDPYGIDVTDINIMNATYITNLSLELYEQARLEIGSDSNPGGSFQVGNTTNRRLEEYPGATSAAVSFTLKLDGRDATIKMGPQSFLGFGVGMVSKPATAPDNWLVGRLYNVNAQSFNFLNGTFDHSMAHASDSAQSSVLAFASGSAAPSTSFNYFIQSNAHVLGGGNMVLVTTSDVTSTVAPTTHDEAGALSDDITAGILASDPMLYDPSKTALWTTVADTSRTLTSATPAAFFTVIEQNDYNDQSTKRATLSKIFAQSRAVTAGYVYNDGTSRIINRYENALIRSLNTIVDPTVLLECGAVGVSLDTTTIKPAFYAIRY